MRAARTRFAVWLVLVTALGLGFALHIGPDLRIETDITAMLPQTAPDPAVEQALARFTAAGGRRNLFLVEAADFAAARAAATAFATVLADGDAFETVELERRGDTAALDRMLAPYRHGLLARPARAALAQQDAQALADAARRALYSPAGLIRARSFAEDPLNLYGDYLAELAATPGTLMLRDGVLVAEHAGGAGVLVTATLRHSPFELAAQAGAMATLDAAERAARAAVPSSRVLASGVLRHAAASSARARREIGLFGSLSLAGVVLVFLYCFRSVRPLLLALTALGVGTLAAISAVQLLFGQVHLLALVFGSSLIGVVVDYAIHFFCDRFRASRDWSGADALAHVGPAILVGMATTALGYLAFVVPPFPGLRQMATFSIAGIAGAGLTVLLMFPALAGRGGAAPPAALAAGILRLTRLSLPQGAGGAVVLAALGILVVAGLMRLSFVDDVRALQSSPPALIADETLLHERLGGGTDTRFFLVEGEDVEALLQREEALRERLDIIAGTPALAGYSALSRAVPSRARQAQHRDWLDVQVFGDGGVLRPLLQELGFDDAVLVRLRAEFEAGRDGVLGLDAWLAALAAAPYRMLWLGSTDRGVASAVALHGVVDPAALAAVAVGLDGVRLVDRVADISTVLAHYRRVALFGLGGALLAIGAVLALRYGARAAPRQLLAPVGACLLTLAALGWLAVPATLFTVLALLLVLGLGVDYSVFLREGRAARAAAVTAVSVAATTTLLAFGMLAASATPFIRSLGLGVLIGVSATWLLALLASAEPARHPATMAAPGEFK